MYSIHIALLCSYYCYYYSYNKWKFTCNICVVCIDCKEQQVYQSFPNWHWKKEEYYDCLLLIFFLCWKRSFSCKLNCNKKEGKIHTKRLKQMNHFIIIFYDIVVHFIDLNCLFIDCFRRVIAIIKFMNWQYIVVIIS